MARAIKPGPLSPAAVNYRERGELATFPRSRPGRRDEGRAVRPERTGGVGTGGNPAGTGGVRGQGGPRLGAAGSGRGRDAPAGGQCLGWLIAGRSSWSSWSSVWRAEKAAALGAALHAELGQQAGQRAERIPGRPRCRSRRAAARRGPPRPGAGRVSGRRGKRRSCPASWCTRSSVPVPCCPAAAAAAAGSGPSRRGPSRRRLGPPPWTTRRLPLSVLLYVTLSLSIVTKSWPAKASAAGGGHER